MAKDKLEVIKTRFGKAEKIFKKEEELKKLKDNSSIKKLSIAIRQYVNGNNYNAHIIIYDLFHVRPWRKKDFTAVNYIKTQLKTLKNPTIVQGQLFAT